MQEYKYLQLQPIDDTSDDTSNGGPIAGLDVYEEDETIDLSHDEDEETLDREWDAVMNAMRSDSDDSSL